MIVTDFRSEMVLTVSLLSMRIMTPGNKYKTELCIYSGFGVSVHRLEREGNRLMYPDHPGSCPFSVC